MIYGYCRVSTDDQSISSDNQRQEIQEYAKKHDLTITQIFQDEDVSGKIPMRDRPQGKLLWDVLQPGDLVIVTKLDRGWRSTADAANTLAAWRQFGVKLAILDFPIDTSTDEGEMMFTQFASWAQYERKRIGKRVSEAFQYLRRNGRPYSITRPFGWVRDGDKWAPSQSERDVGSRILAMRKEGWTWEAITLRLARDGVKKPVRCHKPSGWYYSLSAVHGLGRAARDGYPIRPQGCAGDGRRKDSPRERGYRGPLQAFAK
jgi:DNA invertase Pin-like site-specific DNA recombinase